MEWLVLLAVIAFFYGGKRISQLGEGFGRSIAEFKKAVRDYPASLPAQVPGKEPVDKRSQESGDGAARGCSRERAASSDPSSHSL